MEYAGADAVFPARPSALARGRRVRRALPRARRRTAPVTFAEIKEVDEENADFGGGGAGLERRRPDVLEAAGAGGGAGAGAGAGAGQPAESRRRRAREVLREVSPPAPPPPPARAGSEPAALHRAPAADT